MDLKHFIDGSSSEYVWLCTSYIKYGTSAYEFLLEISTNFLLSDHVERPEKPTISVYKPNNSKPKSFSRTVMARRSFLDAKTNKSCFSDEELSL